MNVKVNVFPGAVRKLTESQIKALKKTAEQVRAEIIQEQVIPFDTGHLQNTGTYVDTKAANNGEVKIVHDTPYASRVYYHPEFNFQKTFNKNAQGLWWDRWLTGDKKDRPSKIFKVFYKKAAGGVVK